MLKRGKIKTVQASSQPAQAKAEQPEQAIRREDTFAFKVMEDAGRAPARVRQLLLSEWMKRFPTRAFPDVACDADIFLALRYKQEMEKLQKAGKEVSEKFASNYNNAMRMNGFTDGSLNDCLKRIFKGDRQMNTTKKIIASTTSTKTAAVATKKASAKATASEEKTVKTDTVRYVAGECFSKLLTNEETAQVMVKRLHREISLSRISSLRNKFHNGAFDHLGFNGKQSLRAYEVQKIETAAEAKPTKKAIAKTAAPAKVAAPAKKAIAKIRLK